MADQKISARTLIISISGSEKIPVGTPGNEAVTPNQLKAFILSGLTKADVGLDQVDNTADTDKPVSSAQAGADATILITATGYTNVKHQEALDASFLNALIFG